MVINVLQYLEQSVQRVPEKLAFVDEKKSINYKDLHNQACKIGTELIQKTQGSIRKPVVVFVDRNIESLVAFMGVAYSGNFYVPIDMQMPKFRVELILNTLNPAAMVVTPVSKNFSFEVAPNLIAVNYEEAVHGSIDEDALQKNRRKIIDRDPIYATFTSGSTGIPKGVVTCHQSVIDMTEALVETFDFDVNHIFGNQNPFYFDASIKDIYCSLKCGATMFVLPKSYFMMLGQLVRYINEHRIDTIMWSASAISLLANAKAFEDEKPLALKKVMFSGEVMHNRVLNYWRKNLPHTQFVNLYGPTEITSVCTYYKIERPFSDDEVLPIGIPFRNCEVIILNENNEEIGEGESGELCVKGSCLALGYYNNPEKTAAAFCQNPLNTYFPEIIYRTGDLARFNEYGEIMFLSRKDNQVKHMGQRVELGEIEILLNAMDKIDASICFYDHDAKKIIAVYKGQGADSKYIYAGLKDKVSKFMFPNVLISLAELPYNLNGKIDRTVLKELYFSGALNEKKNKSIVIGSGSIAQSCIFNLLKNQFEVKVFEFANNNSSPLKGFCEKNKVDYTAFTYKESLNNAFLLIDEKTLVVSASNRYLFPEEVILNNNLEIINYHSSLLPKYPGRNAEAWAIFEGEVHSGITWHKVVKDIDEGEIILQKCTRLSEHTTSLSLLKEFNILAIQAFEIIINDYQKNGISYSEQKGFDKFNLRYSWMRPNDAILDTYWTEVRISQFLRAFDYGIFKTLGSFIVSDFDRDQNFYEYFIHNKANFEAKFSNNYTIEKETKIFELRIDER